MAARLVESKTIMKSVAVKPVSKVRFNRGDENAALLAAARVSLFHEMPSYVLPTCNGWSLEWKRPTIGNYYKVMGRLIEVWLQ